MTGQPASPRRRGGRPAQVNRQDIVAAAITVIDAEGLEALTMRRLAAELGVTAMSLYRHLANRGAVLSAVVDHLAGQALTDLNPPRSWRQAVRDFAEQYRAVLLRHPRAVPLLATHPVTLDAGLALISPVLHRCETAGMTRDQAVIVIQSVTVYTLGHALAQVGTPPEGEAPPSPSTATPASPRTASPAATTSTTGAPGTGTRTTDASGYYQQWYESGLDAMLEGFHIRLSPSLTDENRS